LNTPYKKYEFCTSKGCIGVQMENGKLDCPMLPEECLFTAKELHLWIDENGFEIVKKIEEV